VAVLMRAWLWFRRPRAGPGRPGWTHNMHGIPFGVPHSAAFLKENFRAYS
jgi:hypothetical protein